MMVPGDAAGANPQLALIDIADGKRQVLKLAYGSYMSAVKPGSGAVLLSPDERFVALSRSANLDDGSIVVFPLDGGPAVGVTGTGRVARLVGWHSSGRLLYTSDRAGGAVGIWSIAINGGKPSGDPELVHGGHHPQERPWLGRDGALHYEQWGGLSLVQTATLDAAAGTLSAPKPSTKLFASGNWAPDFSPDGKFLMYTTAYSPGTVKFVIKDLASGNETAYQAPFRTVPNRVLWYPDGSALLVPAIMDRGQETVIYRFVPATGEAKPLLTLGSEQIARAGRYAYVVEKGKPGIQKLDLASGERQPVTLPGSPGNATPLAVASDGSRIAYGYVTGANPGSMAGTVRLATASLAGGGETVIAERPMAEWRFGLAASWTPDGRTLLYGLPANEGGQELWMRSDEDRAPRRLYSVPGTNFRIAMHPNGRDLALATRELNGARFWVVENLFARN
jgi:hypothetical protein